MPVGPNDLKQFTLPATWDAAYLERYRLADGVTYDQLVADIGTGLTLANADLLRDPLLSSLVSTTTEIALEYRVGVTNGFQEHTEYSRPDAGRGATSGHMLPLKGYDRGLGWTWDFLRKARRMQIDADIAAAMQDLRDLFARTVLTRLFRSTFEPVGAGRSVPLADGGVADANYVPLPYPDRGGTFTSAHTHLAFLDGIIQANLETAVAHVWEHGYDAPYDLLIAQADIASWTNTANVTGFVPRPDPLLRYGATADLANVSTEYIGAVETDYGACRMRVSGRVPTGYWAVYKSYGAMDDRNPLKVRLDPTVGQTIARLLAGDHIREFPLENAILFAEFGVGVADRVSAIVVRNDAAAYVNPVIS